MVPEVLLSPQSDGTLLGTRVTRNIRIETDVTDQFTNFVQEPVMTTDLQESQAVEAAESSVLDKTTEISAAAKEAFEQQDYSAVVRRLEKIPESILSSEDHVLLNRARHYRQIETRYTEAKLLVEREQFEMALRILSQIPQPDRNEGCIRLMNFARIHARITPLLIAADHCLKSQDYEEVVRIFEEIPIESRTDELIKRLSTAHLRIRQLSDARATIEQMWKQAEGACCWESYSAILPYLEQVLSLKTNDETARLRIQEIAKYRVDFKLLSGFCERTGLCIANRDYAAALEKLEKIPERVRGKEFTKLFSRADNLLQEVEQLTAETLIALQSSDFETVEAKLPRLDEIQYFPCEQLIGELSCAEYEACLFGLAERAGETPSVIPVLDQFLQSVSFEWILGFLADSGRDFPSRYPPQGTMLAQRLCEILDRLAESPAGLRERLEIVRVAKPYFADVAEKIDAWDDFFEAVVKFDLRQSVNWTWLERIFECAKSNALDAAACRLAESADGLLPAGDDRWTCLQSVVALKFNKTDKPTKRVYEKIAERLSTSAWSSRPLTPITVRRALQTAAGIAGLSALGLAANVVFSLVFDVGGMLGFGMVFVLAGLWTFFCFAANRIL